MSETTRIRLDKQIQRATKINQVPLSDINGELQYADIFPLVKQGETLTRMNSVEVSGGNLIIKYTAEDGNQQVVSTGLNFLTQDIKVSDARMDNPSSGVYRLIITESDGKTYPVDLSALLASVTTNTEYITISGNGTPADPLKATITQALFDQIPKRINQFSDTLIEDHELQSQTDKNGRVVLCWDNESRVWYPQNIYTIDELNEVTDTFVDVRGGDSVVLSWDINKVVTQSIKVYRNGLRQVSGIDYSFANRGKPEEILFTVPFKSSVSETIVVDYRPYPMLLLAA